MILTRSPYYINDTIIYADIPRGILALYIWEGLVSDKPASPTYEITKEIYGVVTIDSPTTELTFEISNLIRDYYNPVPVFSLDTEIIENGGGVLFVEGEITYPVGIQPTEVISRMSAIDGYGYFMEGANPDIPDNNFLLSNNYYVVNKQGFFNVPFRNTAAGEAGSGAIYINGTPYLTTPINSTANQVNNLWINLSFFDENIEVVYLGETIYLELQTECKYQPVDVMFLNKYGSWEIMSFFKAQRKSINTDSKDFKNNVATAGAYLTNKAQYQRYNVNGQESLKLNSGYLPETYNETVTQLLLSEKVYLLNGGNHIPMKINTQSYEFKTRINDKLISHEIDMQYAFDLINNI